MKNLLKNFQSLSSTQLLKVNGGYSGSSSGSSSRNTGTSTSRGYGSSSSGSSGNYSVASRNTYGQTSAGAVSSASVSSIDTYAAASAVSQAGSTAYAAAATNLLSGIAENTISQAAINVAKATGLYTEGTYSSSSAGNSRMGSGYTDNPAHISELDSEIRMYAVTEKKQKYQLGVYDCDMFVQEVCEKAGFTDLASVWGNAKDTTCDEHVAILGDKLSSSPDSGWSIVLMTDGHQKTDGSGKLISHAAMLEVDNDTGAVTLYQNSSAIEQVSRYDSIQAFQNDYGYDTFSYLQLTDSKGNAVFQNSN